MKPAVRISLFGILGGILYTIGQFICTSLPYIKMSDNTFNTLFILAIIWGIIVSCFTVCFKSQTIIEKIIRFVIMIIVPILIIMMRGYRFIYDLLNLDGGSGSDNVSGMMTLSYIVVVIISCIIFTIRESIVKAIIKQRTKK